jgi:hypothetical protein
VAPGTRTSHRPAGWLAPRRHPDQRLVDDISPLIAILRCARKRACQARIEMPAGETAAGIAEGSARLVPVIAEAGRKKARPLEKARLFSLVLGIRRSEIPSRHTFGIASRLLRGCGRSATAGKERDVPRGIVLRRRLCARPNAKQARPFGERLPGLARGSPRAKAQPAQTGIAPDPYMDPDGRHREAALHPKYGR